VFIESERVNGIQLKDISMYLMEGHANPESGELVLATDKRGQRLKPTQHKGEWLPIGELGSKSVYEVSPEQFIAVTPSTSSP
jgi:hypothetical protein